LKVATGAIIAKLSGEKLDLAN